MVQLNQGLNPNLLDHWQTLYKLAQWPGHIYIYIYIYIYTLTFIHTYIMFVFTIKYIYIPTHRYTYKCFKIKWVLWAYIYWCICAFMYTQIYIKIQPCLYILTFIDANLSLSLSLSLSFSPQVQFRKYPTILNIISSQPVV